MKQAQTLPQFFFSLLMPYRLCVVLLGLSALIWALQMSLAPYLLKVIIDVSSHLSGSRSVVSALGPPVLGYLLVLFVGAANFRLQDLCYIKIKPSIRCDVIESLNDHVVRHSHEVLQDQYSGNLAHRISEMAASAESVIDQACELFHNLLALLVALVFMGMVHVVFSFTLLVSAGAFLGFTLLFTRRAVVLADAFSVSKAEAFGYIVDALSNNIVVKLFSRYRHEQERLGASIETAQKRDRTLHRYILKMRLVQDTVYLAMVAALLGELIYLYHLGEVTLGDFALILMLALSILQCLWFMAGRFVDFAKDIGRCRQGLVMLNHEHAIQDVADAGDLIIEQGEISFEGVNFAYQDDTEVFHELSFEVPACQKVGLVGYSGSGKSTLVNLLLRVCEADSGRIRIDGHPIDGVTQDSLRRAIAVVPQEPGLFHRSLMENIRYGRWDASDEEVIEAAKRAECHAFIEGLPQGYETLVGERGVKLSGGQRQRIAIARAMLKDAPILVLDEATSSLDPITEQLIKLAIERLMVGKTVIVIAHRLTTLSHLDRLLVLDRGQLVQDGAHAELVSQPGLYQEMWEKLALV